MAYNLGQTETKAHLKAQLTIVCQGFCLQNWAEALNATGVDQSSELRNPKKVVYPLYSGLRQSLLLKVVLHPRPPRLLLRQRPLLKATLHPRLQATAEERNPQEKEMRGQKYKKKKSRNRVYL